MEERHRETLGSRPIEDSTAKHPCAAFQDGWFCATISTATLGILATLRLAVSSPRSAPYRVVSIAVEHLLTTRNPRATTLRRRASALAAPASQQLVHAASSDAKPHSSKILCNCAKALKRVQRDGDVTRGQDSGTGVPRSR